MPSGPAGASPVDSVHMIEQRRLFDHFFEPLTSVVCTTAVVLQRECLCALVMPD